MAVLSPAFSGCLSALWPQTLGWTEQSGWLQTQSAAPGDLLSTAQWLCMLVSSNFANGLTSMKMSIYVVWRKIYTRMWCQRLPVAAVAAGGWGASAPTASAETGQKCPESPLSACYTHPRNDQATAATEGSKHTPQVEDIIWEQTIAKLIFHMIHV